jgi:hypothetical protein
MSDNKLVLPPEYEALNAEKQALAERRREVARRMSEIRRAAVEAAGWRRCCRCFPGMVSDDGFCGCCLYNHVTGEQIEHPAPYFEPSDAFDNPTPEGG